jgi:hypothetical protein
MATFKFSKNMMDSMEVVVCTSFHSDERPSSIIVSEDQIKSLAQDILYPRSYRSLQTPYVCVRHPILQSLAGNTTGKYHSVAPEAKKFAEDPLLCIANTKQATIDEIIALINKNADMTISSLVGAFWNWIVRDRVHPKAGLLTVRQILEFYTTADGEVDFGHFTQLKDAVNNRSMNLKKRSHWPQRQQHAPQQHAPQPREWTPRQQWSSLPSQASPVDQGQIAQLMKMVEQLSKTVETQQAQIEALQINDAAKQAQIDAQQSEIEALKQAQIDAKTQKQQKIESLQKQLAELL